MDTNVSLNYWLRRHQEHKMTVQYDGFMKKYVATVHGPGSPSLVGYGYDVAGAISDLNVQAAAQPEEAK